MCNMHSLLFLQIFYYKIIGDGNLHVAQRIPQLMWLCCKILMGKHFSRVSGATVGYSVVTGLNKPNYCPLNLQWFERFCFMLVCVLLLKTKSLLICCTAALYSRTLLFLNTSPYML